MVATSLVLLMAIYAYGLVLGGRRVAAPAAEEEGPPLFFVILVPCLNESAVIGKTLASIVALSGRHHVVVIDDASDDDSRDVIGRFPAHSVSLIRRSGRDARVGKGAALNHGLREILAMNVDRLYGADNVIVVVFDSDSRVPSDFLDVVRPYFADPRVGGVQTAVRMYNAGGNRLTFWQDMEFLVWGEVFSRAKDRIGSATLGGNGQCVRLSALRLLGPDPWRPSLTEDLDLSLRLLLRGTRIRYCGATAVAQEAITRLPQLVRQRTRWVQGHFAAWEYLPRILRSGLPIRVRFDLVVFLLLPVVLGPLAVAAIDGWTGLIRAMGSWSVDGMLVWYALAFASAPLTAWALRRHRPISTGSAIVQAHVFVVYGLFWTVAAARAAVRIISGDRSWAKTSRMSPRPPDEPSTVPVRHRDRAWRLRGSGAVAAMLIALSFVVTLVAAVSMLEAYASATTAVRDDAAGPAISLR